MRLGQARHLFDAILLSLANKGKYYHPLITNKNPHSWKAAIRIIKSIKPPFRNGRLARFQANPIVPAAMESIFKPQGSEQYVLSKLLSNTFVLKTLPGNGNLSALEIIIHTRTQCLADKAERDKGAAERPD